MTGWQSCPQNAYKKFIIATDLVSGLSRFKNIYCIHEENKFTFLPISVKCLLKPGGGAKGLSGHVISKCSVFWTAPLRKNQKEVYF